MSQKFVVSWGFIVDAENFTEAEKKAKAKLKEVLGDEAYRKLDKAIDELCISDWQERDEPE
jgi:hypothetical protein